MKLALLSILFLLVSFTLTAQINKKAVFLGADISFNGGKNSSDDNTNPGSATASSIGLSVSAGKAVKDNLVLGVKILYSTNTNKQDTPYFKNRTSAAGGGIWIRKYYPLAKSFYLFLDGSINVQGTKADQSSSQQNNYYKSGGFFAGASVYPGVSYQMLKCFFLDASVNNLASLNYSRNKVERKDSQDNISSYTNTNYGISTSIGNGSNPLQIGMRWIIAGK